MYAIKWTRCTGESGIYKGFSFNTKEQAQRFVNATKKLDNAKRMSNAYKYEIIEIG